jgi:Amt family ammonium transporter
MAARSRREAEANSYEASHDPLTGLLNRRAFVRQFEKVLDERSVAVHDALLFCDLDGFKHVNDTGGHAAGDAMLAAVALELKGQVRHDDLVARMGGDEFALLLIDCSLVDARPLAEAIVRAVESVRLPAPHGDLSIGVSIGLTMVDSSTEQSLDEHLRHVDDACYAAKKSGGDRVIVYDDIAAEAPA